MSTLLNNWVFGLFTCSLLVYCFYYFNTASLLFVCAMTTSRLLILQYPFRARNIVKRRFHIKVTAIIWTSALSLPVTFLIVDKDGTYFDFRGYTCDYNYFSRSLFMDTVMITVFYCPLAVISATTPLLIQQLCKASRSARRVGARDPRSSILTVILTACLFLVQITPNTIYLP